MEALLGNFEEGLGVNQLGFFVLDEKLYLLALIFVGLEVGFQGNVHLAFDFVLDAEDQLVALYFLGSLSFICFLKERPLFGLVCLFQNHLSSGNRMFSPHFPFLFPQNILELKEFLVIEENRWKFHHFPKLLNYLLFIQEFTQ